MTTESRTITNPFLRLARAFLQWFDTSRSSSFDAHAKD